MLLLTGLAWLIAAIWVWRTVAALRNLPRIPNLLDEKFAGPLRGEGSEPKSGPTISVIVPARDEAAGVEACLRSLLAVEGVRIEIIAVNDRSTDETGAVMNRVTAEAHAAGVSLRVLHVEELPEGWMGKTHAMAIAASEACAPWLLFTDADILFAKDALRRAMNYAGSRYEQQTEADHVVVLPTLIVKSFGERMFASFFQATSAIMSRFWRIAEAGTAESIGVGAFNLVRADVYREIGGFEALRMEVLEDLRFGFVIKSSGYRQRVAFGRGLVRVRWAEGLGGLVRNVTKNFFAIFRFRVGMTLAACAVLAVMGVGPFVALAGPLSIGLAGMVVLLMLLLLYQYYGRYTGTPAAFALTFPLAAILVVYSILRSMLVTLTRGGVRWRGTLYPLAELRRHAGRLR
jgi:glycosyltransferase involved in cell wall biosynthesis